MRPGLKPVRQDRMGQDTVSLEVQACLLLRACVEPFYPGWWRPTKVLPTESLDPARFLLRLMVWSLPEPWVLVWAG